MRCPYCRHDIRLTGPFCPRCGRRIMGLPERAPGATAAGPSSRAADTGPAPAVATPPVALASGAIIGKTCPYDQFPITTGDEVVVCPQCGTPHHLECWQENQGCTRYGCAAAPVVSPPVATAGGGFPGPFAPGAGAPGPFAATSLMEAELDRTAGNALLYAVIGLPCCPILSLVGFFIGVSVFAALERTQVHSSRARTKATWAVLVGALGPVAWTAFLIALGTTGSGYAY